jgi:succinate dehydrogenase hydrophobic anchor subunit
MYPSLWVFRLNGGEYGMSAFLLLIASTILFAIYMLWTIGYFFIKRKILNTSKVIIYFSIAFLVLAIADFFDIINLIFLLSLLISSAIIYFLNKVLNEDNFNKLIS